MYSIFFSIALAGFTFQSEKLHNSINKRSVLLGNLYIYIDYSLMRASVIIFTQYLYQINGLKVTDYIKRLYDIFFALDKTGVFLLLRFCYSILYKHD